MADISVTLVASVPDGPVCENWGYRTFMPKEQHFRCEHLRRDCQTFTDRDMGGHTDRMNYMHSSRCALFDRGLRDETGVGPHKCSECVAASQGQEGGHASVD